MDILVSQCLGLAMNLPDSMCQNKALKTPFQYVLYLSRPKDIFPQRGLNTAKLAFCGAKVQLFLDLCKNISLLRQKCPFSRTNRTLFFAEDYF